MARFALLVLTVGAALLDGAIAGGSNDGVKPIPAVYDVEEAPPKMDAGDVFEPSPKTEILNMADQQPLPSIARDGRRLYQLSPGVYTFQSPNYPRNYPNNINDRFSVRGTHGQVFTTWCTKFNLESSAMCRHDYLSINGHKYCGSRGTLDRHSHTVIDVIFRSDGSITRSGFYCYIHVPKP